MFYSVFHLTGAVFEKAGESNKEEKEELWKKLTVRINDKIRGLKNGKYKKQWFPKHFNSHFCPSFQIKLKKIYFHNVPVP